MKHFFILTNTLKDSNFEVQNRIVSYLEKKGMICEYEGGPSEKTECILVLGGDGTLLQAARENVHRNIPLIGVNLGSLGYLAEVDLNFVEPALDALIADEYSIEKRMLLTGKIIRKDGETFEEETFALNDVAITRGLSFRIISFNTYVNGQFLNHYHADGIIVSTPTGSTGYNLSAGGPIVDPIAELMVMTPICPHTINTRSIVLSPCSEVEIEIPVGKHGLDQEVEVYFDSSMRLVMNTGDRIQITQYQKYIEIIKISKVSFLEVLRQKMSD